MRSTRQKKTKILGLFHLYLNAVDAGRADAGVGKEENESRTESLDEKALQEILGQLDFQETNEQLKEFFPGRTSDFKETVTELISGGYKSDGKSFESDGKRSSVLCIPKRKKEFDRIILLALIRSAQSVFERVSKSSDCRNQLLCYVFAFVGIVS